MSSRRTIFRRIFALYGIVLLCSAVFMEIYITRAVRTEMIANLAKNLSTQALLIARDRRHFSLDRGDMLARDLKQITFARVTLIAADGCVLGDSDHESRTMENHSDRIEIRQAAISGKGISVRKSSTLGYDLMYVAVKIPGGNEDTGYIRLSVPLKDVNAAINALRFKLFAATGLALLVAGLYPLLQMLRLRSLAIGIRDFARAIVQGDLGRRLIIHGRGEFDEIAESLNTMSSGLQKASERIFEENKRLNAILETVPDAMLISDADGVVRFASRQAHGFFGIAPVVGKRMSEIIRTRELFLLIDRVRNSSEPGTEELRLDHPEQRHVVVRIAPLSFRAGEVAGYVAIFHDITRIRLLERTRRDFVANVSHELKTPLAAIQGFAETLLDGALSNKDDARRFVEIIHKHSSRLGRLVDDLLTLSRIETGETAFHIQQVDVAQLIDNAISIIRRKAEERSIHIAVETEDDLPHAEADPDRLTQVLLNLLDNAVKFSPDRTEVMVYAHRVKSLEQRLRCKQTTEYSGEPVLPEEDETMDRIEISIHDSGPGIPAMHIPRLGERFYRVDTDRSRELGGTGLGLAIVKHILQAHGSALTIKSTPRRGTIVSFCIKSTRATTLK